MCRCNAGRITQWRTSWASLEATGCRHWASACAVLPQWLPRSSNLAANTEIQTMHNFYLATYGTINCKICENFVHQNRPSTQLINRGSFQVFPPEFFRVVFAFLPEHQKKIHQQQREGNFWHHKNHPPPWLQNFNHCTAALEHQLVDWWLSVQVFHNCTCTDNLWFFFFCSFDQVYKKTVFLERPATMRTTKKNSCSLCPPFHTAAMALALCWHQSNCRHFLFPPCTSPTYTPLVGGAGRQWWQWLQSKRPWQCWQCPTPSTWHATIRHRKGGLRRWWQRRQRGIQQQLEDNGQGGWLQRRGGWGVMMMTIRPALALMLGAAPKPTGDSLYLATVFCPIRQFCQFKTGMLGGGGGKFVVSHGRAYRMCTPKPTRVCPMVYTPVCNNNGNTHSTSEVQSKMMFMGH